MKPLAIFFLCSIILGCSSGNRSNNNSNRESAESKSQTNCDEETAKICGKLYILSDPIYVVDGWADFIEFANNNINLFYPDCPVSACMRTAGNALINKEMQLLHDPNIGSKAYESALGMGASIEDAGKIKSEMEQGQFRFYKMGIYLIWLSKVMSEGNEGNWKDLLETGYFERTEVIEMYKNMIVQLQQIGYDNLFPYLINEGKIYQPEAEYEAAVMVHWFAN
jgi:hypothetical protein